MQKTWHYFWYLILPILVFALVWIGMAGPMLNARLGMIDDHETMQYLGSDGRINLQEIPSILLNQTEVGKWGSSSRYRPVYYTLRIIESAVFGSKAVFWYSFSAIIMVLSWWGAWLLIAKLINPVMAYLFVFYLLTIPLWGDLLTRLGPSEIYAVAGMVMCTWALYLAFKQKGELGTVLWLLLAGYTLTIGVKENFLILLLPLLVLVGYRIKRFRVTPSEILVYLIILSLGALVVGDIITYTSQTQVDFYGTSISYPARIKWLILKLPKMLVNRHVIISFGFLGYWLWQTVAGSRKHLKYLWVSTVLWIIIFGQYIFYNNNLPANNRYDFPALILLPTLNLLTVAHFSQVTKSKLAKIIAWGLMSAYLLYFVVGRGYGYTREMAIRNSQSSQAFAMQLDRLVESARSHPNDPVILVSSRPLDYELVLSSVRFARASGVSNKIELAYSPSETNYNDPLLTDLDKRMKGISRNGGTEQFAEVSPLDITQDSECLSVAFHTATPYPPCREVAVF